MFLKKKINFKILSVWVLLLGLVVPVFPVYAQDTGATQQINIFEAKLDRSAALVFSNDPKIISESNIFPNSASPLLQNVYQIKTLYSLNQIQEKYGQDFLYIQPEYTLKIGDLIVTPEVTVNDPGFTVNAGDINRTWGLSKAEFTQAWNKTTGNASNVIAVIDTGIDGSHEDLSSGQVGQGFDFLNHTILNAGADSDDNGHGTLVSGVIAATPNNFRGISGTNWNVTLMPLKALDSSGSGNSADVAAAIVYAADHGASIINMSLGGVGFGNDTTMSAAISYAFSKNVVLVSAAGNDVATDGGNLDGNPVFPVCDDNGSNMIIGVAASDYNDQKASFSNFGKSCVDVTAPGKHILSTINIDPSTKQPQPNSYAYASGTSLAAPFVSGEAALIKSLYPQATNKEIRDRIIMSADSIDSSNLTQCSNGPCTGLIGSGRINAYNALDPNLLPKTLQDGDLVRGDISQEVYFIVSGQKEPVSNFVLNSRFAGQSPTVVSQYLLDQDPTGSYALPPDGTLVKSAASLTVYQIVGGLKQPVTYQVFLQHNYTSAQVNTLPDPEINSWLVGNFLPPVEGTLIKTGNNKTVYWTINGLLHPMNGAFYYDRGLNIFPILVVSDNDLKSYAKGNAYIR